MKYIFVPLCFLNIIACAENPGSKAIVEEQITKAEVHETLLRWAQAMLDNRLEPQQQLLDDTWMYSGSDDGMTTSKEKALGNFKRGETSLKGVAFEDTIVRIYGDVAIVTGKEELLFVEKNDTNRVYLRFTDVFRKKDGKVTALSTHSSPIGTNKAPD